MRRNHRSHLVGAIAVAGMLLVAGCTAADQGASPTPPRAPTATSSASVSPTPAPTTPEPEPTPTVERNRETAKQFIIDYFEAYEEGFRSADASSLDLLRTKECGKCKLFVADIKKLQADGARWPQAAVEVLPFVSQEDPDPDLMQWEVQYKSDLGRKEMRDGSRGETARTVQRSILVEVRYVKGQWRMNGVATGDGAGS